MTNQPTPDRLPEEHLAWAIGALTERSGLRNDERVHALARALVVEVLRPYWAEDRTATEASDALRVTDPELAELLVALAPMLLARMEAHDDVRAAVATAEALLGITT